MSDIKGLIDTNLIGIFITAFLAMITSIITAFLTYRITKQKQDVEDKKGKQELDIQEKNDIIRYLNERFSEERRMCEESISELKSEIEGYHKRIQELESQVISLSEKYIELPFAHWKRDSAGVFLHINKAALKSIFSSINLAYEDLINKHPKDCLPASFLSYIEQLDNEAMHSNGSEACLKGVDLLEDGRLFVIHKKIITTPVDYKPISYECWVMQC